MSLGASPFKEELRVDGRNPQRSARRHTEHALCLLRSSRRLAAERRALDQDGAYGLKLSLQDRIENTALIANHLYYKQIYRKSERQADYYFLVWSAATSAFGRISLPHLAETYFLIWLRSASPTTLEQRLAKTADRRRGGTFDASRLGRLPLCGPR